MNIKNLMIKQYNIKQEYGKIKSAVIYFDGTFEFIGSDQDGP